MLRWTFSGGPALVAAGVLGIVAAVLLLSGRGRWLGVAAVVVAVVGTIGVLAGLLAATGS